MECKCPSCTSNLIKKNGHIHNGKQKYQCLACKKQFVLDRMQKIIDEKTKNLVIGKSVLTDFFFVYTDIIPYQKHRPVEKKSGKTSYIERLNCTLRQRCSRLVKKTLSFSKKLVNHDHLLHMRLQSAAQSTTRLGL